MKTKQQTILETYLQPLTEQGKATTYEIENFLKEVANLTEERDGLISDQEFKHSFVKVQSNSNQRIQDLDLQAVSGF